MSASSGSMQYSYSPNEAGKTLGPLVGEWDMLGTHPGFSTPAKGHSSFHWFEAASLMVWRFDWERPGPPCAISVIGHDDSGPHYSMLYSDERGVARVYQISLDGRVWKMWRDSPGFSQRMLGQISEDGNSISVHGELCRDGSTWERDLDVTYTRAGP